MTQPQLEALEQLTECVNRLAYVKRAADVRCTSCGVVVHIPPGVARRFIHQHDCEVVRAYAHIAALRGE
jgi:hypothetical protein